MTVRELELWASRRYPVIRVLLPHHAFGLPLAGLVLASVALLALCRRTQHLPAPSVFFYSACAVSVILVMSWLVVQARTRDGLRDGARAMWLWTSLANGLLVAPMAVLPYAVDAMENRIIARLAENTPVREDFLVWRESATSYPRCFGARGINAFSIQEAEEELELINNNVLENLASDPEEEARRTATVRRYADVTDEQLALYRGVRGEVVSCLGSAKDSVRQLCSARWPDPKHSKEDEPTTATGKIILHCASVNAGNSAARDAAVWTTVRANLEKVVYASEIGTSRSAIEMRPFWRVGTICVVAFASFLWSLGERGSFKGIVAVLAIGTLVLLVLLHSGGSYVIQQNETNESVLFRERMYCAGAGVTYWLVSAGAVAAAIRGFGIRRRPSVAWALAFVNAAAPFAPLFAVATFGANQDPHTLPVRKLIYWGAVAYVAISPAWALLCRRYRALPV